MEAQFVSLLRSFACVWGDGYLGGGPVHPAFGTRVNVDQNQAFHQPGLVQLKQQQLVLLGAVGGVRMELRMTGWV